MTKSSQSSKVLLKDTVISYETVEEACRDCEPILREAYRRMREYDEHTKKSAEKQSQK